MYHPEDYCLRMVLKMCYYISELRFREILNMNADFYIDDDGKIWFLYAKDILVQTKKVKIKDKEVT